MNPKKVARLALVSCLLLLPAAAWAQQATGSITGVARDTSGAVMPGVTVEAASPALIEKVRSVVTSDQGLYQIVDLRTTSNLPFVIEQVAAFATGATAAMAAFASIVPGYNRKALLLPVLPIGVWLGSVGQGCLRDWIQFGSDGLSLRPDWICFPVIALMGTAPAIAMTVMLRRGAPLRPRATTALGGLAAAGLGNFGLRFVHVQDASVMVLVWQCGAVFALSALAGWAGPSVLNWRSVVNSARRRALVE